MSHRRKVSCVLCGLSEETKITGALSIKDEVTAHQNCLLFSSGIYCQNTPELDDLFGFSTEDVLREVKRGRRLVCKMCGKKGATAGCEVGRCKKTYHYPCAIQAKAKVIEDEDEGRYTLYCFGHNQKLQSEQSSRSVDERPSSSSTDLTSRGADETRARDKQSKRFVDEHPSSSSTPSVSRENGERRGRDAESVYNSDSNSSRSATHSLSKRRLSDSDEQDELFIKRKNGGCKRNIIKDSPKSDDNEPNTEMAPIESDIDESTNSIQDDQVIRENADSRTEVASDKQQSQDDETLLYSDESESLLHPEPQSSPVTRDKQSSPMAPNVIKVEDDKAQGKRLELTDIPTGSSPQQNLVQSPDEHHAGPSTEPPPSPSILNPQVTLNTDIPSPPVHPSASSIDSVSFWKSCNSAGCTQAIFTDFLHEMNKISRRIESDQASQEDYDLALKVIADSGKLAHLVDKQREELQRKQTELKKAGEAMNEVVSALKGQFKP